MKGHLVLNTNGGVLRTNLMAYVKGFKEAGKVWYSEKAITNILSLSMITKKFRVTFDSQEGGTFILHRSEGNMSFKKHRDGLY